MALLASKDRRPARLLSGGVAAGASAGLLAMLGVTRRLSRASKRNEGEEPSTAAALIARIPTRVKLAAAGGAVAKGGKEAAREVGEKVKEKVA